MPTPTVYLTQAVVEFAILIRVVSVAMTLLSNHGPTQIPDDVIAEMVYNLTCDHDVWPLSWKRHSSDADDPHPTKMGKQIQYDREQANKCLMDDWLGPIPRFPDKLFEYFVYLACNCRHYNQLFG